MSAKDITIKPIPKNVADKIVKKYHYSGKTVSNSNLNFGVYYKGILLGAMQYGSPMVKEKMLGLVKGATWDSLVELNRMAFSDRLPRFGESRCISQSIKWMKKNAKHIKWIISFADGTQCGHGTIYQASNFMLTNIKKNIGLIRLPNGNVVHQMSLRVDNNPDMRRKGYSSIDEYLKKEHAGFEILKGYMFRYIYFIDKEYKENFTGEDIPFCKIKELGIEMYKGKLVSEEH